MSTVETKVASAEPARVRERDRLLVELTSRSRSYRRGLAAAAGREAA